MIKAEELRLKYYWIVANFRWHQDSELCTETYAIDKHPFEFEKQMASGTTYEWYLVNWKEITPDEYELYKKLQNL